MIKFLKVIVSVIIGQTLFFKFSGASESVYIFTTLGVEPWGRIALAVIELLTIVLLWIPALTVYGILLVDALMLGAIGSHLTLLGIEVLEDGGKLFLLALISFASGLGLTYYYRKSIQSLMFKK